MLSLGSISEIERASKIQSILGPSWGFCRLSHGFSEAKMGHVICLETLMHEVVLL